MKHGFPVGSWAFSQDDRDPVRILESQTIWNHTSYLVWRPSVESVAWIAADQLSPLDQPRPATFDHQRYRIAAARVIEGLAEDVLLAPLEADVIPLPHQLVALSKAMAGERVRYLLADEVGLGKTIEAGLIIRELKLRGLVKRVLVCAPKGLVAQWVQEMRTHFHEEFRRKGSEHFCGACAGTFWQRLEAGKHLRVCECGGFAQMPCCAAGVGPRGRD